MSSTSVLANYIVASKFEDLPEHVIRQAKRLVLDSIACAFGAYNTKTAEILVDLAKEFGGLRESTLIGDGAKVPCKHAAFVNAHLGGLLDLDETWMSGARGHPGSQIVHTSVAVAERNSSSGRDLINAVVTAYEVATRISDAISPSLEHLKRGGATPHGCWSAFGPAAAAAKLLDLNREQTHHTLGIAGANARLAISRKILELPISMVKGSEAWHSEHGVEAALLAQRGFTGVSNILDDCQYKGFWAAASSDRCNWTVMTQKLGEEYNILRFSLKTHPCCRAIHPSIDAATGLIKEENIDLNDIEQIIVRTTFHAARLNDAEPKDMFSAEFSIPWAIALATLGYEPGPEWYAEERFRNPSVLKLAKRVRVEADPEANKAFEIYSKEKRIPGEGEAFAHTAIVEITANGRTYTRRALYAKGDPQNPLTNEELENKFRVQAKKVLTKEKTEKLIETINKLEEIEDVRKLTGLYISK